MSFNGGELVCLKIYSDDAFSRRFSALSSTKSNLLLSTKSANTNIETFHQLDSSYGSIPQMTVDDLLAPGREPHCPRPLKWKGYLHDKGKISKAILKMMKSDLPGAYPTYKHLRSTKILGGYRVIIGSYDLMWKDEHVQAKSSKNSTNRRSERGGYGIAIHNTGAKSFERRKDEMDAHQVAKPVTFVTKSEADCGDEIHVIKGHRFGFGTLRTGTSTSASFMSNLDQEEHSRIANEKIAMATEKIVTLENDKAEKDKVIQYLQDLAHKVVDKFQICFMKMKMQLKNKSYACSFWLKL
ncbi:hypothetical protein Bca52824_022864 [Brassica carinata]|uniref:Uncharacterized protein n=1 Tax=Brassica carinata TaxID=52824 RepID=A0A8X8AUZ7_BRACI|nr:hypothetical protein Bca52824_022864 [Brassica carinata]